MDTRMVGLMTTALSALDGMSALGRRVFTDTMQLASDLATDTMQLAGEVAIGTAEAVGLLRPLE